MNNRFVLEHITRYEFLLIENVVLGTCAHVDDSYG